MQIVIEYVVIMLNYVCYNLIFGVNPVSDI